MNHQPLMLAAGILLPIAAPALGQITYLTQNRSVSAQHGVSTCTTTAPDFAPFNASCIAGGAAASQQSTLSPSGVTVAMSCYPAGGSPPSSQGASFDTTFSINLAAAYTLTVESSGTANGAQLTGPGVSVGGASGTWTGILPPGSYHLVGGMCCQASSSFTLALVSLRYTIESSTIDCGGGASSSGTLTLDGTIGQCDAVDALSGDTLKLTGGFWLDLTPPCFADFNHDTSVDFFDYLDFIDAFSAGDAAADFNHDSSIDFFDYLDFVDAFSTGC